jgi:hypothetical protein
MRLAPPSPTRSASAVQLALIAQVTSLAGLVIFEGVRGRRLAHEIAVLGADPSAPQAQTVVGAVTLFAVLVILVITTTAAAVIAYLTWLVRVRQATEPRGRALVTVLAAWLVPGVNLVAPPLLVDRAWRAAGPPRPGGRAVLVWAWWASSLAALTLTAVRLSLGRASAETGLTGLGVLELGLIALAAALCATTVRRATGTPPLRVRPRRLQTKVIQLPPVKPTTGQPAS